MGRAKILENLGEGHYRIGLDLDLSYARRQLAEAQAYLAAFAARYQAAQDAVTAARAALVTVNDDLSSYLAAAQAACEAAYQAERAAYQDYIDAMNSQPAPGVAAGLLASAEAAHDAFMGAFTDEMAITATAADADYQAGVGLFLDEPAVLDAEAVKLSGLSALLTARDEYADDLITLAEYQAAQNAYDTLRGDWLTVIADNSGDPLVKHYKDIWEAARDAFDKARADLGKLIGNGGGIPAELEALLKKQAETYAALRAAEKDLQSLTLIKAEKERFILELTNRLAPYTDEQGEPIFPPVNAWCVDYTDDLAVDATVGTIEIPGERYLSVRVRPGYESREVWNAEREGLLSPSWSMSPETNWFNWALHPGNARWNPNARLGVIQAIDSNTETCTVVLDPQSNSPATVAPEGAVMEVNSPIKYVIDENGVEQTVLPGPNVSVVEGVTILANVPIEYMECNSGAFVVGDHVMVQFTGQDWTTPKVVGFAESPRPCAQFGVVLTGLIRGTQDTVFLKDLSGGGLPKFTHLPDGTVYVGNIDWISADKKIRLTWDGPLGRNVAPGLQRGFANATGTPYLPLDKDTVYRFNAVGFNYDPGPGDFSYGYRFVDRFSRNIYRNSRVLSTVGPDANLWNVLGATALTATSEGVTKSWLVAVFCRDMYGSWEAAWNVDLYRWTDHVFAYAPLPAGRGTVSAWTVFHTETLSDDDTVMPPVLPYCFSASGAKFSTLIPQAYVAPAIPEQGINEHLVIDEYMILRGQLTATVDGVQMSGITRTAQHIPEATRTYNSSEDGDGSTLHEVRTGTSSYSGTAIVALDYQGETEVSMTATYLGQQSDLYERTWIDGMGEWIDSSATASLDCTLTIAGNPVAVTSLNYGETYHLEPPDGEGPSLDPIEIFTQTSSVHAENPLFLDLRQGIYWIGQYDDPEAGDRTYTVVDQSATARYANTLLNQAYPTGLFDWLAQQPGVILAGGPWSYSYRTTRNPNRYTYPMEAYLQPVDGAANYVGYCRFDERTSGSTGNSVDVPIALASSFDLDALWQAHAADMHPPDVEQGETVFTDSAAVSGLKPLGRV